MSDSDMSPQLDPAMSIPEYKKIIQDADNYLNDNFTRIAIDEIVKMRSEFFDSLLLHLWQCSDLDNNISLNAIGGYGRQTLHPHSDIDLCIIFDKPLSNHDADQIARFFTRLWDLGLDLGHSVRALDEINSACTEDITIATSLFFIFFICRYNILVKLYLNDSKLC